MSENGLSHPQQPSGVAEALVSLGMQVGMLLTRVQWLEDQLTLVQDQLSEHFGEHAAEDADL